MSTLSINSQATNVLKIHDMTPESLLSEMVDTPNAVITYNDAHEHVWQFIARRRCRLFLLAKGPDMEKYEDIYCSARL
jgi:hypothetical protein